MVFLCARRRIVNAIFQVRPPHNIDAAIVVIGADPPVSGEELQLVETVAEQVRDLLFGWNKADRVSNAERRMRRAMLSRSSRKPRADLSNLEAISLVSRTSTFMRLSEWLLPHRPYCC